VRGYRRAVIIALVLGAAAIGACGAESAEDPPPPLPTGAPGSAPALTGSTAAAGGRTPLEGFREVTVTVVDADGRTRTFCLLLADTPDLQQRGLMHVTDAALGGYDGMVFSYEQDDDGGFWMRNTRLPLSIAWIRADGSTVSTADMQPCPDSASTCPVHAPGGPYRFAVEVPQGRLDDLGISDRSRVTLGAKECSPA
jgi:uncharacterized protein